MKKLNYVKSYTVNRGTDAEPDFTTVMQRESVVCADDAFESVYAKLLSETYNSEIAVEDIPEPETAPTEIEQLRADVDYIAMETGVEL